MEQQFDDFVFITHEDAEFAQSEPGYLSDISEFIDSIADDLWPVNKKIHDNPELGYEEFIAHETLTKFMASRPGWKVTPSAYGLATAWVAVFDSGRKGPVVSFNVEMDALDGIGHACGHNLIATASVAGGLATAKMIEKHQLSGKVVVFGTPAEEGGGGKIKLLEAGAYRDYKVDINLISHPGITKDTALMRTSAYTAFKVEYFGREAHAAASPWLGINALDALITSYNALSVLRQQTMPGDVIQGNITDGGVRPNVIHAYTAGNFVTRANTQGRVEELKKKVDACFEAGATATGARLQMTHVQSYADHVPNRVLGASYRKYFNALSPPQPIPGNDSVDEAEGRTMASTDQGDISYAMPSLSAGFAIPPGPGGNGPHNPEFAKAAGTRVAFERCLRVGKALAGTAVDVLTQDGLLEEVKKAWKREIKGN
ncbi:Peptidase M20 domain-containing protein 2 [Daldinia childiae]|uniref:Peptidase M20 domain-containing protein 2 n=1 Tax=Daldinia childiae TaxID=326645 RepID=UPI0014458775|nr:Peptidase M20 domain-containing protein 2 [Daldinia childiae]KAF3061966.1 Peptidase M20 domain-containing protein 2 [Daldinia childiae]